MKAPIFLRPTGNENERAAAEPLPEEILKALHIKIKDWRDVERQGLREEEAPDDRQAERPRPPKEH